MLAIKSVRGGGNRFAGCKTTDDMKARLHAKETIGKYTYGGGSQVEVRKINGFGRMVRVATAEIAE